MAAQQGGHNAISIAQHQARRTLRPGRHLIPTRPAPAGISDEARRAALRGLTGEARQQASGLLRTHGGWDSASLGLLRAFVLSGARLRALEAAVPQDVPAIHRETRTYVRLAAALRLEARRIDPAPSAPPNRFAMNCCPPEESGVE
jgi:hypothetical protein